METGDQGPSWYVKKVVDLGNYVGSSILIRYTATNNGPLGNIALDNVRVRAFEEASISDITQVDPTCELDNGSITINFDDVINTDTLNFSIDGGVTWSATIADNSGATTFPDLGPGSYDLRVRNNDGSCEVDLSDVTLVNQASPTVTFSMTDLDYCIDEGSFTLSGGLPADGEYTGAARRNTT